MKRRIFSDLENFITDTSIRTCILTGPPFVGKTYLASDLLRSYSLDYLYLDLRYDREFSTFCRENFTKDSDLSGMLSIYFKLPFETLKNIPVVLDEVGYNETIISLLTKYVENFSVKDSLKLFIICGTNSSLIKQLFTDNLNCLIKELKPFSFDEFLLASDHQWYMEVIEGQFSKKKKLPEMLHNELNELFDVYMTIGGMPSAILEYLNYEACLNIKNINEGLRQLTALRYNNLNFVKLLNSIDNSLSTKTSKYTFSSIQAGATSAQFGKSLEILEQDGILNRVTSLTDEYNSSVHESFRLYPDFFKLSDSKQYESYVCSNLKKNKKEIFFYETPGRAFIDFIYSDGNDDKIPLLIKEDGQSRDRALNAYLSKHHTKYSIIVSDNNIKFENSVFEIPFYCMFLI